MTTSASRLAGDVVDSSRRDRPTAGAGAWAPPEVAALKKARFEILGEARPPIMLTWQRLIEHGWTPGSYPVLVRLAEHALAIDSLLAQRHAPREGATRERTLAVARILAMQAETATSGEARVAEVLPWLEMLIAEPDFDRYRALYDGIYTWSTFPTTPVAMSVKTVHVAEYTAVLGAALGALAWAAGLAYVEAVERQHTGTLDVEDLRVLVGLRGYRLPNS